MQKDNLFSCVYSRYDGIWPCALPLPSGPKASTPGRTLAYFISLFLAFPLAVGFLSIIYESRFSSSEVQCKDCPYGASCRQGHVYAIYNYWGHVTKLQNGTPDVTMIECPDQYCCQEDVSKKQFSTSQSRKRLTRYDQNIALLFPIPVGSSSPFRALDLQILFPHTSWISGSFPCTESLGTFPSTS